MKPHAILAKPSRYADFDKVEMKKDAFAIWPDAATKAVPTCCR